MGERTPSIAVIVVAAGSGSRLGAGVPKAFVDLSGQPMLAHALYSVAGMSQTAQVVIVAPLDRLDDAEAIAARAEVPAIVVPGANSRQGSVAAGLAVVDQDATVVLVHDAARALTPPEQFDRVVEHVLRTGEGVIPGLPVSDTVKRIDHAGVILGTVDRSELTAVQTPQGFPRDHLDAAYRAASDDMTDDAALVAAVGHPVSVIAGDPRAFKITTAWDLQRAEQLLQPGTALRVGVGTDTHAFDTDADAELWLAGLFWPAEPGLAGHSDGDVVAHAITDALLSAAGLGDIGGVFGVDDPRLAGAHGEVFLREVRAMLGRAGLQAVNVSVQLIGNRPRFAPRRQEAERHLSGVLGAPVTISATTTDGIGFTGRGEGVAAIATALIS